MVVEKMVLKVVLVEGMVVEDWWWSRCWWRKYINPFLYPHHA